MPIFVVNKPLKLSSHDVVAKVRKLLNTKKVGHAGTLDPLATGVLVILTEEATKLSSFLSDSDKHYLAWVSFGASTETLDAEGEVTSSADASSLSKEDLASALLPFLKLSEQLPPQYSAIKQGGVKGYEAARKGEALELPPRPAKYHHIEVLGFAKTRQALPSSFSLSPIDYVWYPNPSGIKVDLPETLGDYPSALFYLRVKAGTYIRAFARDLGKALGLPAHLSGLVRTRAGNNGLEQAINLETISQTPGIAAIDALPFSKIRISADEANRIRQGQRLNLAYQDRTTLISENGDLIAIVEKEKGKMKFLRVWQAT